MSLSVLCVTTADPPVLDLLRRMRDLARTLEAEFVLVADGPTAAETLRDQVAPPTLEVTSEGYLESVYEQAVAACRGDYIFRLDDDEAASPELVKWLAIGAYQAAPQWRFERRHFWGREGQYITNYQLSPNFQTRVSHRDVAGGRTTIHAASPWGNGHPGFGAIWHYKFLLRSREERAAQAAHYEAISPGAASGKFTAFTLPEVLDPIETALVPGW